MECKNAYMKGRIPYVLCGKEASPQHNDRKGIFHAMCAHQAPCPTQNCHKLTGSWAQCSKLRAEKTEKDAFAAKPENNAPDRDAAEGIPAKRDGDSEAEKETKTPSTAGKKGRKAKKQEK